MSKHEYRVTWKREGLHLKEARFATLVAAERHFIRVATSDPHWRCDDGYCAPGSCDPLIIDGPHLSRRTVGDWELL